MPTGTKSKVFGNAMTTPPLDLGAGDPTWVAGSPNGLDLRLNAINEAGGVGSNTNGMFSGGGNAHVTTFAVSEAAFMGVYKFGIANITDLDTLDASGADTQTVITRAGVIVTQVSIYTVYWTDEAGDKYQPRVGITGYTTGSINISYISDEILPSVAQNQRVRSDPGSLPTRSDVEKLDSSGNMLIPMSATATPFWLPPGLSLLYLNEFDSPNIGYLENKSTIARTMIVTATVYPRFYS
jgi:hypothetical protein